MLGLFKSKKKELKPQKRYYEGAARGKKFRNWFAPSTSARSEVEAGAFLLRDRVRDLVRNDPLAARAVAVIQSNVVGKGIRPQIMHPSDPIKERIEAEWKSWAESIKADFSGQTSFYGIQSLAIRALAESGEVLVLKRFDSKGLLRLQVIECDHLDETQDTKIKGEVGSSESSIKNGIEFNSMGEIEAYYIYDNHPGDPDSVNLSSTRYEKKDVIHLFRVDRPGQIRGVPWGAPAVLKMRDLNDYEYAELQRQKIATCFAAFIKRQSLGEDSEEGEEKEDELDTIVPGMISKLGFDEEISFSSPPQPADQSGLFRFAMERRIAMAWGVPVSSISGDLTRVNFSSGRMGRLDFYRNVDQWQDQLIIPKFCDTIIEWWLDSLTLQNKLSMPNRKRIYYTWVVPERAFVDPAKETKAIESQIAAGLMSKSEAIRMRGKNPEDVFEQIAKDKEKEKELGIYEEKQPSFGTPPVAEEDDQDEDEEEEAPIDDTNQPQAS